MDFTQLRELLRQRMDQQPKLEDKLAEGTANIQGRQDASDQLISDYDKTGKFNTQAARDMNEDPMDQMGMGRMGIVGSTEKMIVGAGKPVQISDGSKSAFQKGGAQNLRDLEQMKLQSERNNMLRRQEMFSKTKRAIK